MEGREVDDDDDDEEEEEEEQEADDDEDDEADEDADEDANEERGKNVAERLLTTSRPMGGNDRKGIRCNDGESGAGALNGIASGKHSLL